MKKAFGVAFLYIILSLGTTSALAGHGHLGGWCQCGTPNCICDPGEEPGGNLVINDGAGEIAGEPSGPADIDYGSGTLILALFLFVWVRVRA
jgi:hypothetical protein